MFKNIVVLLDGSEVSANALRPATAMAEYLGCQIRTVTYHSRGTDAGELTQGDRSSSRGTGRDSTRGHHRGDEQPAARHARRSSWPKLQTLSWS